MSTTADQRKRAAAQAAAALVQDDMLLGLGTGSTAKLFVAALGARLAEGSLRGVRGVPTSAATAGQATELGIPLEELTAEGIDLAVDGTDELTAGFDATKGMGGALLREKIVAAAARRFVLIADDSKLVDHLGQRSAVPVEVARFGWRRTLARLAALAYGATLRTVGGEAVVTDNGNYVIDCRYEAPFDPAALAISLSGVPGVLAHGLFLGLVHEAFVGGEGGVRRLVREDGAVTRPAGGAPQASSGSARGAASLGDPEAAP